MLGAITENSLEIYHILNGVLVHEEKARLSLSILLANQPGQTTDVVIYDRTL